MPQSQCETDSRLAEQPGPPAPVKGKAPALTRAMTAATAFQTIGRACLTQMAANERPLLEGDDPEAVHQMRVAIRRLRSAMTLFKPVVADAEVDALKDDLRSLMAALGPARDADVFLLDILGPVRGALPDHTGLETLRILFEARRDHARAAARAAVSDARFTRLRRRLGPWIEDGDWRDAPHCPARDRPITPFARDRLTRRWRPVARDLARFADLPDAERHQLRIQIKKMRYAVEFFGSLFKDKKVARWRATLARAQDQFGVLNDVAVAEALLHDWITGPTRDDMTTDALVDLSWAAGLVAGWHQRAARDTLATAGETVATLRDLPRFWR